MHYKAVLLPLFLSLAASVAQGDEPSPMSVTPTAPTDDFVAGLQAAPVPFENVKVLLDVNDEISLEVSYDLLEVGHVSITVHGEDDGSGHGLVRVGDTVVAEVELVDGAVVWEATDSSTLSPAQAHAAAASIMQVWHEDAVTAALDSRGLKCWWAGKIAGATIGVAVFGGCGLVTKSPSCYGHGVGVGYGVAGYITAKCNGAQNT